MAYKGSWREPIRWFKIFLQQRHQALSEAHSYLSYPIFRQPYFTLHTYSHPRRDQDAALFRTGQWTSTRTSWTTTGRDRVLPQQWAVNFHLHCTNLNLKLDRSGLSMGMRKHSPYLSVQVAANRDIVPVYRRRQQLIHL